MKTGISVLRLVQAGSLLAVLLAATPAVACGFGEAPTGCGDSAENEARYMLNRVVTAVNTDKAQALSAFSRGEDGFRSVDSYVFCVGPDGTMTAHPNAILRGQNVSALHDETGNYFIATMMQTAEAGKVSQIRYLFPRPGGTTAAAKTTWYTRAGDQVCGVGVYDQDEVPAAQAALPVRIQALRQKLSAVMPANLSADWAAYLQALDEQAASQTAAFAKAREQLHAADAALATEATTTR